MAIRFEESKNEQHMRSSLVAELSNCCLILEESETINRISAVRPLHKTAVSV